MKGLSTAYPIDTDLKVVKDSDGTNSALEISKDKVRVKDLEVTGTTIGINEESTTVDSSLTDGSTNPVENNAVFDGLALKLDKTGGDLTGDITITDTTAPQLVLKYALTNKITFGVASTGTTTLTTSGSGTTDSDFILDIDGDIALDSANGIFMAKNNGTEFSATDSSYAGMLLGYSRIANDSTTLGHNTITMDGTLTVLQTSQGTDIKVTFVAPPSGKVEISMSALQYASSKQCEYALSDNATYNEIDETHTYDSGTQSSDETDYNMIDIRFVETGLTAGTSYTRWIAGAETVSGTTQLVHGRNRSTGLHAPPIIVRAIALPVTLFTGE